MKEVKKCIQVYTGNGKGKTTASLGLALRAVGQGFKVCMIQFMKNDPNYGEIKAAEYLPGFSIIPVGRNDFVNLANPEPIDIDLAQQGWELAKSILCAEQYDVIILDEINVAMACNLLNTDDVITFLQTVRGKAEILLTGRYAPQKIRDFGDLVTEMAEIRHPYAEGLAARCGIEY